MAKYKGKLLLLKIGAVDSSPVTIAGVRDLSVNKNGETVDVTSKDSQSWRELLEGGGINSLSITCDGLTDSGSSMTTLNGYYWNNTINTFSIFYPNGDTIQLAAMIESLVDTGGYNNAQTFSLTLQSAGVPVFTAA